MNTYNWMAILAATALVGCGGSGTGLDDKGQPVGSEQPSDDQPGDSPAPAAVTLTRLQNEIFTPICAQCHVGASAPQGLRLDSEDNSYRHLVNVDSNEVPTLKRVAPGDPDASYLIHKVEGRSSIVGSRMPLAQAALSSQQIADIRSWISAGALQSDSNASATRVVSVVVDPGEAPERIRLNFSRVIDPDSIDLADIHVTLQQGQDAVVRTPDSMRVQGHQMDLWLSTSTPDQWRSLTLGRSGGAVPQDRQGRQIDGDQDQQDGGVYEYRF